MRRIRPALIALLALLLAGPVFAGSAGRSYSSGGRSFSGGKSSSFSGGHSSSPPAGRSYSSGSKSSPVVPSGSRTTPPRPSGTKTSPAAPAAPWRPSSPPAAKSSPPASINRPSQPSAGSKPPQIAPGRSASLGGAPQVTGRSYSSGTTAAAPPRSRPPSSSGYDAAAAAAQRRQESKEVYTRGAEPKPTYTDGKGQTQSVDPRDQRIEQLRRQVDQDRWANRQQREQQVFRPYASQPVVVYHDPYSSFFWWWLLAQSLDQRALWAYHHQSDMDPARYQDLLTRDRALEARIHELEAQHVPRDPAYTPPGLDPDLAYTDNYVNAAYNPQPQPAAPAPPAPAPPPPHHGMRFITILGVLLLIGFVVWIVFFKRWNIS
jgi:hypothetical protein